MMEKNQAIQVITQLVEQAMANGMFKDFKTFDIARKALITLEQEIYKQAAVKNLPGNQFAGIADS